jgi:5-methylcytosine-specific restriction endonuclease McrA
MPEDLSDELRSLVMERAGYRCEYCLLRQSTSAHRHQPDHILPRQHGGETHAENLALACVRCNRFKGPNVGSYDPVTGKLVPFFNPRQQQWSEHFELEQGVIHPLTPEGRVTVFILRLNHEDRIAERRRLGQANLYP